jgi:hypothetical protein
MFGGGFPVITSNTNVLKTGNFLMSINISCMMLNQGFPGQYGKTSTTLLTS